MSERARASSFYQPQPHKTHVFLAFVLFVSLRVNGWIKCPFHANNARKWKKNIISRNLRLILLVRWCWPTVDAFIAFNYLFHAFIAVAHKGEKHSNNPAYIVGLTARCFAIIHSGFFFAFFLVLNYLFLLPLVAPD